MIERVASSRANVMLMGESGVGKELVARALHNASHYQGPLLRRTAGPFHANSSAVNYLVSEKGVLYRRHCAKSRFIERAEKGTLFLDEITECRLICSLACLG